MTFHTVLSAALGLAAIFNAVMTSMNIRSLVVQPPQSSAYSGMDYPILLPIDPLPPVAMTTQESVQFSLKGPQAMDIWGSLEDYAPGFGWARLGPQHRWFSIVMFHEFHCLRQIQHGILERNHSMATPEHVQHCLHYLRQHILCTADDALDEGDIMGRNHLTDRVMGTAICEDWGKVYDSESMNWRAWDTIRDSVQS